MGTTKKEMLPNDHKQQLVSVIMSFYNAKDTLATSLTSILWQTYKNWELILMDDGSNDDTAMVLSAFQDPRITLVRNTVRCGLPIRLNQAIALAKGRYIARMDADDIAFPDRFAQQVAYLESHPTVDLLSSSALIIDDSNQPIGILAAGLSHTEICKRPWRTFPMPHPTWMGKTDWFKNNRYDEQSKKAQDQELLLRTFQYSHFASLPNVLLGYRFTHLSLRKRLLTRYHHLKTLRTHLSLAHFLLALIAHLLAASRDILAIMMGKGSAIFLKTVAGVDANTATQWSGIQQQLLPKRQHSEML